MNNSKLYDNLLQKEMAQCDAHEGSQNKPGSSKDGSQQEDRDSDIEV